ncbi:MAG: gluconeogenesis factor YvcK family protein [Candidatus Woesearchaeota archaeon]
MKKIVVIGGGTGTYTVLKGLKKYDVELSAVVSMTDDGGSTGRLRDEHGVLPPGDIRRCIVALSESTELMKELFQHRFSNGGLKGHSFGNLLITALTDITGSDDKAIKEACRLLSIRGKVIPVTLNDRRLCAELEDGQIVFGETNIDIPKHDGNLSIKRLFLNKKAEANNDALEAIKSADLIVIGPGDLYSSVVCNFLVDGMKEAVMKSKAKKVYVCNLMTKHGETNGFTVSDFLREAEKYIGNDSIDYVLVNNAELDLAILKEYEKEKDFPVKIDYETLKYWNKTFVFENLVAGPRLIRHDPDRLAMQLMKLL